MKVVDINDFGLGTSTGVVLGEILLSVRPTIGDFTNFLSVLICTIDNFCPLMGSRFCGQQILGLFPLQVDSTWPNP